MVKSQVFKNSELGELNVIYENGKVYVDGIQVCGMLGYLNKRDALLRHCDIEGVVFHDTRVVTGKRADGTDAVKYIPRKYISEGNLYRLILKSKLPSAKNFETWICEEVLPSIRQDGMYMTDNVIEEALINPDFIIQMATKLKIEREQKIEQIKRVNKLEAIMTIDKPYANFGKQIERSEGALTIGQFAKILNNNNLMIGRNRLFNWFRNNGYLISTGKEKNMPKQVYVEQGLFKVCEKVVNINGEEIISATTLITGKGQLYFAQRIFDEK